MADIRPFRAVRYNPARIDSIQKVVSQPYDKIDQQLQGRYYALSPYNIVRIIEGQPLAGDQPDNPQGPNVYTRAHEYYRRWLDETVLVREDQPAVYAYEQRFTLDGHDYVRQGMIAAVRLVDFEEGVILPHEHTHSGPKQDRLRLLSTLQVNTEQIFMLYPDPENRVNALLRQASAGREPEIDVVEIQEDGVQQRIWSITDPAIIAAIRAEMAPKRNLIIADGHHRYETGLNYRNAQRAAQPDASPDASFNFITAMLVSMDDPGLVILPTHREICNFTATSPAAVLERARAHFDIRPAAALNECLAAANADPRGFTLGFYGGPGVGFHILTLKSADLVDQLITADRSHAWKSLPVSILHSILLDQIAGVPAQGIEDKSMIRYHRDPVPAVESINRGEGNFAFFVHSTQMGSIKACAAAGDKMPQKSTDFYPKVISGLTMLPVSPGERL